MKSLADLARLAGFQVLVEASPSCVELSGDGRWHIFEHECYRFVCHSECDHVSIIIRDPLGGRELRDLGEKGERRAVLPYANPRYDHFKQVEHMIGVRPCGLRRFAAQVEDNGHCVYLGSFDDAIAAAMAHDRYAVEHQLKSPLNFPNIRELMKREVSEAVAD